MFFFSYISIAQSCYGESKTIYLIKQNRDTVKIVCRTFENIEDTAYLKVGYLKKGKMQFLQNIKTGYSFPLEVALCTYDNKNGIIIKNDPAAKYGNKELFLFDEVADSLCYVKGFAELGEVEKMSFKQDEYLYSYISCGCADNCWSSVLFKIQGYQINTIAKLSCDCSKLIETYKNNEKTTADCAKFNTENKLANIREYWKSTLQDKGLLK